MLLSLTTIYLSYTLIGEHSLTILLYDRGRSMSMDNRLGAISWASLIILYIANLPLSAATLVSPESGIV